MEIAILSETDSRVLIYPLLKCLNSYGSVAVFTSNKYFSRLIDGNLEGEFRNIRIIVSPDADLEEAKESDGYFPDKYDFVIYDNVGAMEYDFLFIMITNRLSYNFVQDITYIVSDEKTKVLRFGSPAKRPKPDKAEKKKKPKKGEEQEVAEDTEEDPFAYNKWTVEKTDEDILKETLEKEKAVWIKFPSFEIIEETESKQILPIPDQNLVKILYNYLGSFIGIDEHQFMKGVKIKDEGSSDISGTDVW